jgi:hypothetical protein
MNDGNISNEHKMVQDVAQVVERLPRKCKHQYHKINNNNDDRLECIQ